VSFWEQEQLFSQFILLKSLFSTEALTSKILSFFQLSLAELPGAYVKQRFVLRACVCDELAQPVPAPFRDCGGQSTTNPYLGDAPIHSNLSSPVEVTGDTRFRLTSTARLSQLSEAKKVHNFTDEEVRRACDSRQSS
jgi:hypothetical protein